MDTISISKRTVYMFVAVLALSLLVTFSVLAGNLNSSAAPDATHSYTLADIYNRLSTGTAGAPSTFTEPASGPGSTMYDLNTLMAVAPAVDNTNGATVTQVLSGTTYWGLRAGAWGVLTGTMPHAAVPKTGQTTSYAAGDDGDLEMGVAWPSPRFIDNSDGTVTDNLTGLIWLKNANCWLPQTWANALTNANGLASGSCGLNDGSSAGDWRLPNVRELQSLIDYGQYNPALPSGHLFTGVQSSYYWSATSSAGNTSFAWYVNLYDGIVYDDHQAYSYYVWPVRAGQ